MEEEMLEDNEQNLKQRVENISIRTFTIGSCPELVFQRFKKFCEKNAKNVRYFRDDKGVHTKEEVIYHLGLKMLLDIAETDAKSLMLYEKVRAIEDRVTLIEQNPQEKEKPKRKTFGG